MRLALPLLALALACPWAHAQDHQYRGPAEDPLPRPSWQEGVKASLTTAGYLRSDTPTWQGKFGQRSHFGFSRDREREVGTRVSIARWKTAPRLKSVRELAGLEFLEIRGGRALNVRGKGLAPEGNLDEELLRLTRKLGWGRRALADLDLEGLALIAPGTHYALAIPTADFERVSAAWRGARKGKPLARLGNGPRLLDRLLPWAEWEDDQGPGIPPFTLSGSTVEPTPWRFARREWGAFQVLVLSRNLPGLLHLLGQLGLDALPEELAAPQLELEPLRLAETPAQGAGGLTAALDEAQPGETSLGMPLLRESDRLYVVDGLGLRQDYDPERHGIVRREPPLPPHLGVARKDGRETYLVRRKGRVHALLMGTLSAYDPAKHGDVEVQPPLGGPFGATAWGYPLVNAGGDTYVLREELPPASYDPDVHGQLHTFPPE